MLAVAGLPPGLAVVPPGPNGPDDPARDAKADAWEAWRDGVLDHRAAVRLATDPRVVGDADAAHARFVEQVRCATDPVYFTAVWCSLHESRPDQGAGSGRLPAIPYPFQADLIRWLDARLDARGPSKDGLISKARDLGATWEVCLFALWAFLYRDPFIAKFVSRREEHVDSPGNLDSMFERVTFQLNPARNPDAIPAWLLPPGFDLTRHRTHLKLIRPDNQNAITGESTSARTGRGGRATLAVVDELAFIDHAIMVWDTLAATAGHRVGLSSESVEVSDDFATLCTDARARRPETVVDLDWWRHPLRGPRWLTEERERYADEAAFAREVLRDPHAGFSAWVYPQARALLTGSFPYQEGQPVWVSIDPGFDDETAVVWFSRERGGTRIRILDSWESRGKTPEFYADLILGLVEASDPPPLALLKERARTWGRPRFVYGDPAGHNHVTGAEDSWYDRMMRRWARQGWAKEVTSGWKHDQRGFQGRRNALRTLLPQLDVDRGQGAAEVLHALAEARWETGARTREQKTPRHDQWSHRVTAVEYFAVNHEAIDALMGQDWKPRPRARGAARRVA